MKKVTIEGIISKKEEFTALQKAYQLPFLDLGQMYRINDLSERTITSYKFTGIIVPSCIAFNTLKIPRL